MTKPPITNYATIVVGTDGSDLAGPTVRRAARIAAVEDADLVIVCVYSPLTRRAEAKNAATLSGNPFVGTLLGRDAASIALADAVAIASREGATIAAALLVEGEPSKSLITVAVERKAELVIVGATSNRSIADKLLGTVGVEVTKRAPCDVLVVRPTDEIEAVKAAATD